MIPDRPAKDKVLAIEPAAHAIYRGCKGVYIEAHGEVIASAFTVYRAWAKALEQLQQKEAPHAQSL